jgi:superfamily II DNA or RNA helicase
MSVLSEPSVSRGIRRKTGEMGEIEIKKSTTPISSSSSSSSIAPPPIPSIPQTSVSSVSTASAAASAAASESESSFADLPPPPPVETPPTSSEAPPPPPPSETPPPPPPMQPLPKSVPVKESKPAPPDASPIPPPSPPEVVADENEAYSFLYPTLEDPNFNTKIASKKEFADTQYDGVVYDSLAKIKEHANNMCRADFQLSPHQLFVRNFLSFQTPYNSLLLYHGLGTGKTCSAITICEEMRDYLSQIGMSTSQKIIIVASPNVQDNFKLQLFDRRKLKLIDGIWNIRSCTGNKYLKEINPMNMKGMDEDKVIKEVKKIIRRSYQFLGYDQFATLIEKTSNVGEDIEDVSERTKAVMQELKKVFGNSLIVIDEFHNIRNTDDSSNRAVATQLQKLVKFGPYLLMRLLLLSGTPMYNSYREIIWLINIMRLNDGRPPINMRDIFNDNPEEGIFIETKESPGQITETGRENLRRFSTGYISYIRGENPYTFPYRIYPDEFAPDHTFSGKEAGEDEGESEEESEEEGEGEGIGIEQKQALAGEAGEMKKLDKYKLPTTQLNKKLIPQYRKLENMQDKIYLSTLSDYQQSVYSYIIKQLNKSNSEEIRNIEKTDSIGITLLQRPLEALNIAYPADDFDPERVDLNYEIRLLVGKYGLRRVMDYNEEHKSGFKYKDSVPPIFSTDLIGNYSSKIKSICDNIYKSEGIILIYSFYIDGGVIPLALALESMGFTRYGTKAHSLFDKPPAGTQPIDGITSRKRSEMKSGETFFPAKYIIISGDKSLSPDTVSDIKATTNEGNYDGRFVKVVIISKSGTEGLDFKNIRQTHILEPWYNINLIEQTIGRAVRNCSHKDLEFEKRNVQIFLHGSILSKTPDQEAADVYMYRLSERKARYIGEVSRVLKESAVDCLLNIDQTNFTEENFDEKLNGESVTQILSSYDPERNSNITIEYKIGDKNNSPICDYMECVFTCKPDMSRKSIGKKSDIFTDAILTMNTDKIIQRIRDIFQERYFYKRIATSDELKDINSDLISTINYNKKYPIEAIDIALTQLLEDKNEFLRDKYGRYGRLINVGSYYFFQPLELNNPIIPLRDRQKPVDFKRDKILLKTNKETFKLEEIKKKHLLAAASKKKAMNIGAQLAAEDLESEALKESEVVAEEVEEQLEEEEEEDIGKLLSAVRKEPTILKKSRNLFKKAIQINIYTRGNNDWYYNCGHVLKSKLSFIPDDLLKKFIVAHILEELNLEDTLSILNHIISVNREKIMREREKNPVEYEFDQLMEEYYENNIVRGNKMEGVILISNNDKSTLFIKNKEKNIWVQGGMTDATYFRSDITIQNVINKDNDLGIVIGFITSMKRNDYSSRIFKTKKLEKGSIAARCDQASRAKTIENLLIILTPEKITEILDLLPEEIKSEYTNYSLRDELSAIIKEEKKLTESILIKKLLRILGYDYKTFVDGLAKKSIDFTLTDDKLIKLFVNRIHIDSKQPFTITNNRETTETELCIFQEILLRFFDTNSNEGKRWFLTPLQVKINNI